MTPEQIKELLDSWIAKYIRQEVEFRPGKELPSSRLNELFNLIITQGDDTTQTVKDIIDYLALYDEVTKQMIQDLTTYVDTMEENVLADNTATKQFVDTLATEVANDRQFLTELIGAATQIVEEAATISDLINSKADKTELPTSLPADGGNSATVNGHTVEADVPANAVFTDTNTTYGAATVTVPGLMSAADKVKMNGVETGANKYTLPTTLPIATLATNGTDYTTSRIRNARFGTTVPASLANGEIYFRYE